MQNFEPDGIITFLGYDHDGVFFEGYEHDEAWMEVDGELCCVWRLMEEILGKYSQAILWYHTTATPSRSTIPTSIAISTNDELTEQYSGKNIESNVSYPAFASEGNGTYNMPIYSNDRYSLVLARVNPGTSSSYLGIFLSVDNVNYYTVHISPKNKYYFYGIDKTSFTKNGFLLLGSSNTAYLYNIGPIPDRFGKYSLIPSTITEIDCSSISDIYDYMRTITFMDAPDDKVLLLSSKMGDRVPYSYDVYDYKDYVSYTLVNGSLVKNNLGDTIIKNLGVQGILYPTLYIQWLKYINGWYVDGKYHFCIIAQDIIPRAGGITFDSKTGLPSINAQKYINHIVLLESSDLISFSITGKITQESTQFNNQFNLGLMALYHNDKGYYLYYSTKGNGVPTTADDRLKCLHMNSFNAEGELTTVNMEITYEGKTYAIQSNAYSSSLAYEPKFMNYSLFSNYVVQEDGTRTKKDVFIVYASGHYFITEDPTFNNSSYKEIVNTTPTDKPKFYYYYES